MIAWIQLFLCDSAQQVSYADGLSAIIQLVFWCATRLCPWSATFPTVHELFDIIAQAGLIGHCYADDTQL